MIPPHLFVDIFPTSEISPRCHATSIRHGLITPMRDGVELSMDLIMPDGDRPFPVVLVRTPYDKTRNRRDFYIELAERGYVVAIQDCRGRFNSEGEFFPYRNEHKDGYDTIEWIAAQPWCDGNVGMAGVSYVGQTQWFAASEAPPHLKAIIPESSPPDCFSNEPILNGCFMVSMGEWMLWMGRHSWQMTSDTATFQKDQPYFNALPLSSLPAEANTVSPWWQEMMRHPNWDDFWKSCSYQHAWNRMNIAALNLTGWWDMNFPGAPTNFAGMREHAPTEFARENQCVVIGPWWHHINEGRELNGVDFGPTALTNLDHYKIRFYDRHLKGIANGIEHDPKVHVFVLGANEWRTAADWPLPGTDFTPYYFHSQGHANSLKGDGGLSIIPPESEPADAYIYDPNDPVATVWRIEDGPIDDRLLSIRDDMLCYSTEVLTEPVEVIGPVSVVLFASSSATDTDWHVRLVDVHPDGAARFQCHGALRARFREGFEAPVFMEPGQVYRFEFGVDAAGVRFLPGHRIRVEVTSSWWSEYDRNTNSGALNNFEDDQIVIAHNRIYHEPGRASHIVLPVRKIRG